MGGYRFTEHNDGSLTVHDVELFAQMHRNSNPALAAHGVDIDERWMQQALNVARMNESKGKEPLLLRGHNQPDRPAEIVGTLTNLRYRAPWIVADIHATEPTVIAKLKRGEMRKRSAEFKADTHHIWGLSLIDGQEGHFDEELPDLVLSATTDSASDKLREAVMLASDQGRVSLSLSKDKPIHLENRMEPDTQGNPDEQKTIESLSAEIEAQAKEIANLKAQIAAMKPSGEPDENTVTLVEEGMYEDEERAAKLAGDPAPDMNDEERKRRAMEMAKNQPQLQAWQARRALIAQKAAKLAAQGINQDLALVRLSACKTAGEIELAEQLLKLQSAPSTGRAPAESTTIGNAKAEWDKTIKAYREAGRSHSQAVKLTKVEQPAVYAAFMKARGSTVQA